MTAKPETTGIRMVNLSQPAECWRCKRVRPPVQHVNVAPGAASVGPAVMAPICEECVNVR
jgi:hypothetical protein